MVPLRQGILLRRLLFKSADSRLASCFSTTTMSRRSDDSVQPPEEVICEKINNRGVITLNRPKVLNSLNLNMVAIIVDHLEEWEDQVDLVLIKGAGGKAFCAGGDIISVTQGGKDNTSHGKHFFRAEYLMNNIIGTYRKPYIALIDGIVMGGGVGLSVHGHYRVATERTLFAMPETGIGLFPDVGGGYFLPRLKGKLGTYLAMTGHRLKGRDVVKAGIATHYINSEKLDDLEKALLNDDVSDLEKGVLAKYTESVASCPFSLDTKMSEINTAFSKPTVEEIFLALDSCGSEFSLDTLDTLKKMSPTSLKITLKQLQLGLGMTLQQVLQMENRLAAATLEGRISMDFYEGVRALLVEKDKKPKWDPKQLEDVTYAMVECMFLPRDELEELIPAARC